MNSTLTNCVLIGLSAALAFLFVATFVSFAYVCILYRDGYRSFFRDGPRARRNAGLNFGITGTFLYCGTLRLLAILNLRTHEWSLATGLTSIVAPVYLPFGVVVTMACLWWSVGEIMDDEGNTPIFWAIVFLAALFGLGVFYGYGC